MTRGAYYVVGLPRDTNLLLESDYSELVFNGEPIVENFGSPVFGWYSKPEPINFKLILGGVAILDIAAGVYNFHTWSGDDTTWTAIGSAEAAAGLMLGVFWAIAYLVPAYDPIFSIYYKLNILIEAGFLYLVYT